MKTVVCLPTYNEEESLQEMIDQIRGLGFDLFVVDAGSGDQTVAIAQQNRVPVYQRDGKGKGWGVRKAIAVAKQQGFDNLVLIDCDCTYPPQSIPDLLTHLPAYDMAVGQRRITDIPKRNRLPNKFFTAFVNLLFGSRLRDVNSGMRVFKVEGMPPLDAEEFEVEAQMTIRALKKKLKIKEVPIEYRVRKGETKVRVRDGFVILWGILKEKFGGCDG
ncbi:MAG: glycosyltransferase [Deltaproteobacteria bacterium]|nr:glycosyltransferase [Deltaproteobacteria bacterium]